VLAPSFGVLHQMLPEGCSVTSGQEIGAIEVCKLFTDVLAPCSGVIHWLVLDLIEVEDQEPIADVQNPG
jgi:biotin carboxyl carrier protein